MIGPRVRRTIVLAVLACAWPTVLGAQAMRLATAPATVAAYPSFFQGRAIAILLTASLTDGLWRAGLTGTSQIVIIPREGGFPSRPVEYHGRVFDVGQLAADDPRVDQYRLRGPAEAISSGRWPARGQLFALVDAVWSEPPATATESLRALALQPSVAVGQRVTVRGRFRGQNLYADLPAWPRQSQWDFILQSGDGFLWVTGRRPRGRGFDLDPAVRRSVGTWLEVTGIIRMQDGLAHLQASAISESTPGVEPPADALPPPPPAPPPVIVFSAPVDGERDVPAAVRPRIQFSRDLAETSLEGRVRARYASAAGGGVPTISVVYQPATRSIEIRFAEALAPGATVVITMDAGITAADGAPLAPASISFTVAAVATRSPFARPR